MRIHDGQVETGEPAITGLPDTGVRCVLQTAGGQLWVGSSDGLFVRSGNEPLTRPTNDPAELHGPILAIAESRKTPGNLVVAVASAGCFKLTETTCEPLEDQRRASSDADAFCYDSRDGLWVASRANGIGRVGDRRITWLGNRQGLFDDEIFGMVEDDRERLWMACSKGIFYALLDDLEKCVSGASPRVTCTPFTPTDAQRTIECLPGIQPAVWKMSDGKIWFSTTRGLLVIDPNHLQRKLPPTPVVVEEVIANGRSYEPSQVHTLAPGETNVSFRYTALSFASPTRITFRYRLEGFDADWIDAGSRREAFYTNLPPGTYRFRVMARNVDELEHEGPESVEFTLQSYIYQKRWFWPACAAVALGALSFGYRVRERQTRQRLDAIVNERSRIARELHDTLMQGFSGITMEMQALAARLPKSAERQNLEEIIRDAGQCLREARLSIAGLRSSASDDSGLVAGIAQAAQQLTETKNFRLKLALDKSLPRLPTNVEYNLLRITQEAIANAVKHSGGGAVEVALGKHEGEVVLSVADDGSSGFGSVDRRPVQAGHYGILGMRERAHQLGASFEITARPAGGTIVSVRWPLKAGAEQAVSS